MSIWLLRFSSTRGAQANRDPSGNWVGHRTGREIARMASIYPCGKFLWIKFRNKYGAGAPQQRLSRRTVL